MISFRCTLGRVGRRCAGCLEDIRLLRETARGRLTVVFKLMLPPPLQRLNGQCAVGPHDLTRAERLERTSTTLTVFEPCAAGAGCGAGDRASELTFINSRFSGSTIFVRTAGPWAHSVWRRQRRQHRRPLPLHALHRGYNERES